MVDKKDRYKVLSWNVATNDRGFTIKARLDRPLNGTDFVQHSFDNKPNWDFFQAFLAMAKSGHDIYYDGSDWQFQVGSVVASDANLFY